MAHPFMVRSRRFARLNIALEDRMGYNIKSRKDYRSFRPAAVLRAIFIKEKTMPWLNTMYDDLGIVFFIVIAVITALAVIRSLVKMKKRKGINITPVGVFNDLPESVTGIRKDKEWEREEKHHAD